MSVELKQQIQELQAENENLRQQLKQKTKVASRALASYQQRALHMELIRQQNEEMDTLLAEVRRLAAIVENHPDFIGVGLLDGKAQYVNPAGIRLMGLAPDHDVTQMTATDFYPSADAEMLMQEGIPTALEKGSWSVEGNLLKADGTTIPMEQTIGINYDANGTPNSFSITMRDITARKKTEAELEDRLLELNAMQQVMRREGWDSLLQTKALATGYQYDQIAVTPTNDLGLPEFEQTMESITRVPSAVAQQPAVVAPLSIANAVVGVLGVQDNPDNPLSEDDLALIELVSQQMAQALQNAELFQQTQQSGELLRKRVEELNCLNDIGREIALTPPIPELLQWVTERIPTAMQHPELCTVAIEYNDQIYGNAKAKELPTQIVNALWVTGEIVGRIYIAYTEKQEFLNEESALLGGIASRAASYIENRNLVEQTQQRAAELEENSNFLNSIIDNIPSGLFVKDAKDLKFVEWNKANESIHGLMKEDLLGKGDRDFFEPEEAEFFVTTDRSVLAGGEMVDIPEEIVHTPHHGVRFLHTRKIPIIGADGQPKFLLGISEDITESKQVKDALSRERDLLQTLMDNSPDHIFFRDINSRFVRTNNSHAQTILGLNSAEEAIGKTDFDLFLQEDAQKFYDEEQVIMRTGQPVYDKEGQVPTIEGTIHWVSEHKIPIKDETGKVTGLLGIARDITDRKQAEVEREQLLAEMQQSQELLRTVIDATPDWILIKDRDHRFSLANKGFADSQNMTVDELIGKNDLDLGVPEEVVKGNPAKGIKGFWPDDDEVLESGQTKIVAVEPTVIDGKQAYLSTIKVPLSDANGNRWGVLAFVRDVTEREELLAQVQRLAAIVENHPDFIGVSSMKGQALYVNPAGLVMMGLPPDNTITSMRIKDFYPPEYAQQVLQVGLPAAIEQGSWSAESVLQKADGITIPVEQTLAINYDSDGNPFSFSITMRDITDRKVADAERERLLAEVEATYRQYVKGEWEQYLKDEHSGRWHIEYGQPDALPANGNDTAKIETPIALRGQQIGKFNLEDIDPNRKWTSEELALVETVSGQLAQTIENLRLFGDTQQRATREQLTRQIADKMRAAPDVDTIVHTGLGELAKVLGVSRTYLKLTTQLGQDE